MPPHRPANLFSQPAATLPLPARLPRLPCAARARFILLQTPATVNLAPEQPTGATLLALPRASTVSVGVAFSVHIATDCLSGLAALTCLDWCGPGSWPRVYLFGDTAHLWQLAQLRRLAVGVGALPPPYGGLGQLVHLQHLQLIGLRDLSQLVEALPAVPGLTHLDLGRSGGSPGSDWRQLRALSRLRVLRLGAPDVAGLASHLPALPQLEDLALEQGNLQQVPPTLAALMGLTRLSLHSNVALAGGWHNLVLLAPQLWSLDLSQCGFGEVPAELSALSCLHTLALEDIYGLVGLQRLAPLAPSLRELRIAGCGLGEVPAVVSGLTALTCLDLGHNWHDGEMPGAPAPQFMSGGWQHLRPLSGSLQALDLSQNGLREVPSVLSGLTGLTSLSLWGNDDPAGVGALDTDAVWVISGWQHLRPLSRLRELDLRDCNLREAPLELSGLTALTHVRLRW